MTTDLQLYSSLLGDIKQLIRHGQLTATLLPATTKVPQSMALSMALLWWFGELLRKQA